MQFDCAVLAAGVIADADNDVEGLQSLEARP